MKFRLPLALFALLACFAALPAQAGFTSLRVFGDSISSTTGNNTTYPNSTNYYEKRYSNGRVWVEVLAQQQGLPYANSNNTSFFGNYSYLLLQTVTNYTAPADAGTALFVVWVNNADLFEAAYNDGNSASAWTTDVNKSLTNHFKIVTNLWGKGARTIIMPNAVDVSTIPFFNASSHTNFIRQQCLTYNVAFASMLNQAKTKCPGLTIITPDFHTLLNSILATPAAYGLTNALNAFNRSVDAVSDSNLTNKSLNGPGAKYIFWDYADPSAKVHYIMGNVAQQLITPVPAIPPQIAKLTVQPDGSNRLDMVN
jgi:phospholipase/lecithinase/hemolysin